MLLICLNVYYLLYTLIYVVFFNVLVDGSCISRQLVLMDSHYCKHGLFYLFIVCLKLTCIKLYNKSQLRSTIKTRYMYLLSEQPALWTYTKRSWDTLDDFWKSCFTPNSRPVSRRQTNTQSVYIYINTEMCIKKLPPNKV